MPIYRSKKMNIKIYLSSFDFNVLQEYRARFSDAEINILLSYGTTNSDYYKMIVKHRNLIDSLILDSGAFSLNNIKGDNGKPITFEGFVEYCKALKDNFDFIFNFDSDFNLDGYETNYRNQLKLENNGIPVVPVVHDYIGEKTTELDEYLSKYDLISLGKSKHKNNKKILSDTVLKIKQAGKKVHLLGVNEYDRLKDLPVDYSDSSNWAQGQIFGFMYYWNVKNEPNDPEKTLRFRDFEPDKSKNMPILEDVKYIEEVFDYLNNELGVTYQMLYGQKATFYRQLVNTHYYVKLQDHLRAAHKANNFDTIYP